MRVVPPLYSYTWMIFSSKLSERKSPTPMLPNSPPSSNDRKRIVYCLTFTFIHHCMATSFVRVPFMAIDSSIPALFSISKTDRSYLGSFLSGIVSIRDFFFSFLFGFDVWESLNWVHGVLSFFILTSGFLRVWGCEDPFREDPEADYFCLWRIVWVGLDSLKCQWDPWFIDSPTVCCCLMDASGF